MANYYTKFSIAFSLPNEEAEAYALDLHRRAYIAVENEEWEPDDIPRDLWCELEGWTFECKKDGSTSPGLWCYSDESGGQDACAAFVQHLIEKYMPLEAVELEYSCDCSKPRLDAFGGGAYFITAKGIESFSTNLWLSEQGRKFQKEIEPVLLAMQPKPEAGI